MFADDLTAAGEGTVASGKFWLGEVQRDVVKVFSSAISARVTFPCS